MRRKLTDIGELFSVDILLRTLFAPWRRIITYPGSSLDAHIRAFIDNLVSRCVGFGVRMTVLFCAMVMSLLVGIFGMVGCLLWPLLPPLFVAMIVWSVIG
ncbi:MAG TPA: hypothetical protein VFL85_03890 [Candidatus Saccharimonadales bacterium]|nr:hypothetical protein [Candidatus Saccharimonadales bacterium]